jgi:hypothetical protein
MLFLRFQVKVDLRSVSSRSSGTLHLGLIVLESAVGCNRHSRRCQEHRFRLKDSETCSGGVSRRAFLMLLLRVR